MAQIYLVSPGELAAHIGLRAKRLQDLDLDPHADDISRFVVATGVSARRLSQMTFRDEPASLRGFINIESRAVCPACADEARPGLTPRLREWTYPFALWCVQHGCRLQTGDADGVGVLGDEASARRGAGFWRALAMGGDETTPAAAAVLSLLLTPCRSPSPAAPWELAGVSSWMRAELQREAQVYPRLALSCVVPEYDSAVAVYDRRLPQEFYGLASARAVERRAVAIGLGRMITFPVEAAVCILQRSDDFGRRQVEESLAAWPAHLRAAIDRAHGRAGRRGAPTPWRRHIGADRRLRSAPKPGLDDRFDHLARRLVAEHAASLRHFPVGERLDRLQALAQVELEDVRRRAAPGRRGPAGARGRADV